MDLSNQNTGTTEEDLDLENISEPSSEPVSCSIAGVVAGKTNKHES